MPPGAPTSHNAEACCCGAAGSSWHAEWFAFSCVADPCPRQPEPGRNSDVTGLPAPRPPCEVERGWHRAHAGWPVGRMLPTAYDGTAAWRCGFAATMNSVNRTDPA